MIIVQLHGSAESSSQFFKTPFGSLKASLIPIRDKTRERMLERERVRKRVKVRGCVPSWLRGSKAEELRERRKKKRQ